MRIGILQLHVRFYGCSSLKEKRSNLKPLLERIHRQFNVTTAEIEYQDMLQDAMIAVGVVNNNSAWIQSYLSGVVDWIEKYFPNAEMQDSKVEII